MAENEKDKKSAPKAASKSAAGGKRGLGPNKDKKAQGGARPGAKGSGKFSANAKTQDKPRKPRVFGPKSEAKVDETKPEVKTEAKPEVKPAVAPETKPEVKAETKPETKAEAPAAPAEAPAQAPAAPAAPANAAAQAAATQQIVAVFEKDGKKYGLNAAQFGQVVKNNYGKLNFPWKQAFWNYQHSHVMFPLLAQLKQGLDPISVQYIDHHERLMAAAFVSEMTLVVNNALWTNTDHRLMQRHQQMLQAENLAFLKETSLDFSSQFTNFYGMYDLPVEVLKQVNGKAIIDGGAYIGDSIHLFRTLFAQSQIYSFEPVKSTFETLSKIFHDDISQGKVTPVNKALGSKSGNLRISRVRPANDALASIVVDYHHKDCYEMVDVTTIDDEVKAQNLQVGLIKLNVEGFETEAIKGALQTIREQKPLLVISVGMLPQEFYELKPFLESLNLGYKFALRRSGFGSSPLTNFVLIAYQPVSAPAEPEAAQAPAPANEPQA